MRWTKGMLLVTLPLLIVVLAGCEGGEGREGGDEGAAPAAVTQPTKVTMPQATSTALKAVPGTARQAKLSKGESGVVAYEVTVQPKAGGAPQNVQVDANTGKVIKTEPASNEAQERGEDGEGDGG